MSLFDFFKKKKVEVETKSEQSLSLPKNELFTSISKYNEYIVRFIQMQQQGNYSPIAAFEKQNGEIEGFLYVLEEEDNEYSLSIEDVLRRMTLKFEEELKNDVINSYSILYHSQFMNNDNHKIAISDDELKAISMIYNFSNTQIGKIGLPYSFENNEITYHGFRNFSSEENNLIFQTKLVNQKDYFQARETITKPTSENEIGLKITKSNTKSLNNTWCGIFGFESFRKPNGSQALREHFALALTYNSKIINDNLAIGEVEFEDIKFKAVSLDNNPTTIIPVVKTNNVVNVTHKEIDEWENIENLEAIVQGNGKDTFGVWYFATDYAENRHLYNSQKSLNIKLSGIAFVLDTHNEEYTAYLPSSNIKNLGCFDFIGVLEDFKHTSLLGDKSLKGYILKVRLITHPEIEDFFTIDMYVAEENMRMTELSKGMKVSGMFQMQGQIAQ